MTLEQEQVQTLDPRVAQIYKASRNGEKYQILYVDDQIVLLRGSDSRRTDGNGHRIERKDHFEKQIEEGFFTHLPDSDLDLIDASEVDWSDVDYIGQKTRDNLHEAGYETNLDIQQADDGELLDVDGVGKTGLENLREFAR